MLFSAVLLASAGLALAQGSGYEPLIDRKYNWADRPYQVDTDASGRGPQ